MAQLLYKYNFTVRLHDIDAVGVMFFARIYYHIQDAYECLLSDKNLNIKTIIDSGILLPISHSEADYKVPIVFNEKLHIEIYSHECLDNEFSLSYLIKAENEVLKARALTRHVCVSAEDFKRTALPHYLKSIFID